MLTDYLGRHGYQVTAAHHGRIGLETALGGGYAMLLLDVMLPGLDGFEVLRRLRAAGSPMNVLLLTARGEDVDRIVGLEIGADDYLPKPFNPRELLARIRAVLRRANSLPHQQRETLKKAKIVRVGHWRINMGRQELSGDDGVGIPLSTAEFRLLKVFLERPGMVLSREQLLDLTVGRTADIFDRSIDNQVSRLRKKIEPDPKNPSVIKTHWGGGYSLSVDVGFE